MASLHKHRSGKDKKISPFWYGKFSGEDGKPKFISTKKTDKKEVWEVALGWQHAAELAREGKLTETRSRKIIGEILERTTGGNIYDDTIEGFLKTWLKGKELSNATGTYLRYEHTVDLFLNSVGNKKSVSISCVTPRHVEQFRDAQSATGKASSSVNVDLETLRSAFNHAKRRGVISVNPVDVIEFPDEQRNTRGVFTGEQMSDLLKAASSEWQTAIMLVHTLLDYLEHYLPMNWFLLLSQKDNSAAALANFL